MQASFKAMAQRAVNAEESFIDDLQQLGHISEAEAVKVMRLYLKEKIARMDYGVGRIQIKHGQFLDKDVIRRAAKLA